MGGSDLIENGFTSIVEELTNGGDCVKTPLTCMHEVSRSAAGGTQKSCMTMALAICYIGLSIPNQKHLKKSCRTIE